MKIKWNNNTQATNKTEKKKKKIKHATNFASFLHIKENANKLKYHHQILAALIYKDRDGYKTSCKLQLCTTYFVTHAVIIFFSFFMEK